MSINKSKKVKDLTPDEVKNMVSPYLSDVKWRGYQATSLSPFREEKTPSFSFSAEKKCWNDKATGESGGLKDFFDKLNIPYPWKNGECFTSDKKNWKERVTPRGKKTTYQYKDEWGKLIYEVIRTDRTDGKKKIQQRQPDKKGGWIYNLQGVNPLPYKLPELKKAFNDGIRQVIIAEGEKCVDLLIQKGLTATTNSGGAGKWKEEFTKYFHPDSIIIIIPDADKPGQVHKEKVAKCFINEDYNVKVIDLGYPIVEKHGKDVYDWLNEGHTTEELQKMIDKTDYYKLQEAENESDIDLEDLAFPINTMPEVIIPLIKQASKSLQASPEIIAIPILTILGAAIGNNVKLEIHRGYEEKANIYTAVVSPPGAKKSPALKIAMKPLCNKQEKDREEYDLTISDSKKKLNKWKNHLKYCCKTNQEKQDYIQKNPEPEVLTKRNKPRYFITDATTEALTASLELCPRGLVLIYDELTGLVSALNQYKGGKGNDRQWILSAWSGGAISTVRKGIRAGDGLEDIIVSDSFISITGGIQPSEIQSIIGDSKGKSSDGFAQRFLIAYPDYCPAYYIKNAGISRENEDAYAELYQDVFDFGKTKKMFYFTEDAYNLYVEGSHSLTDEILNENLLEAEKETWEKLKGQACRLALIIHVCRYLSEENVSKNIDVQSMGMAWALIEYFKANIRKIYREQKESIKENKFQKVVNFLKEDASGNMKPRDFISRKIGKNAKEVRLILNIMVEKGILKKEGKEPSESYSLNLAKIKLLEAS